MASCDLKEIKIIILIAEEPQNLVYINNILITIIGWKDAIWWCILILGSIRDTRL